jgi:aminoglycoside phosphotransferase family enzyme
MQSCDFPDTEAKLRYLESILAEGVPTLGVRRLETHMSWILLGADKVLKLKKPVRYAFLDFSTVQAREHDGREEVRLNRRLAPRVYLGLLALAWDGETFELLPEDRVGKRDRVVDWLVAMERLPAQRMLDQLIASHELRPADIDALLEMLVSFYRHAPRACITEDDYLARLRAELAGNREVLAQPRFQLGVATLLDRMDGAIAEHEALLRRRVRDGRIVDGHGDLRPEHVCLVDPPVVIDALEFDARLREVDAFDELCFLALECRIAGDAAIGPRLISGCAAALGDEPPAALLRFHTARRALLRARLSMAHLLEPNVRNPGKWTPQAVRYLEEASEALRSTDASLSSFGASTPTFAANPLHA